MTFRDKCKLENKAHIAQIALAALTAILVVITYLGIRQSNLYTRQQIELQYQPFLTLDNPGYFIRPIKTGQWQYAGYFPLINYGSKPAFEAKIINDKVIFIKPSEKKLEELREILDSSGKTQTEKDKAIAKYRSYRSGLIKMLSDYLMDNPEATAEQVRTSFNKLKNYKPDLEDIYLDDKGEQNFQVNLPSDIYEFYPEPSVVFPYRAEINGPKRSFSLGREVAPHTDADIADYKKTLFVYFAAEYQGIIEQEKPYTIYYTGYHDQYLKPISLEISSGYKEETQEYDEIEKILLIPFTEFKIWSDRTFVR